jgi:hypothetical protein
MHGGLILRVPSDIGSALMQLALDELVALSAEIAGVEESDIDVLGLDPRSRRAKALFADNVADHPRADPPAGRADLSDALEHADKPRRCSEY